MLVHSLVIERPTAGAVDDYNQPSQTFATLATVRGLVQPISTRDREARERAQTNQAGVVVSDYYIFAPLAVDLRTSDRVVYSGDTYEITRLERRDYGSLGHLKAEARKVTP